MACARPLLGRRPYRRLILALAALPLFATAALAAPTCVDRNGDTIRCGTQNAMPVGWTPSPAQLLNRYSANSADSNANNVAKAICLIGLLLTLIALMPEFDGTHGSDWGQQEDDE
jgi:hypothetical protein